MRIRLVTLLASLFLLLALVSCQAAPTATPLPTMAPTELPSATPAPTATPVPQAPPEPAAPEFDLNTSIDAALKRVAQPEEDAVAVVNGTEISVATYDEFMRLRLRALSQQQGTDYSSDEALVELDAIARQVLAQLTDVELLRQQAAIEGILPQPDEMAAMRETIQAQVLSSGAYATWDDFVTDTGVSDATFDRIMEESIILQKMIDAHSVISDVEQVHAQHILVTDEALAAELVEKIANGEDFAQLASENSQDPGSAANGGDLGWFPQGVMVPEFESAAFALSPGEVSGVVTTTYGFHIIKTLEKDVRPLEAPYDEMAKNQVFEEWYLGLRDQAEIELLIYAE